MTLICRRLSDFEVQAAFAREPRRGGRAIADPGDSTRLSEHR